MDQNYVLSYDLGTSGVKGALVLPDGRVLHTATCAYPLYRPGPRQAEQNPEDYWNGVCQVTRRLLSETNTKPSAILGIAFGTQWRGVIPISRSGEVLHNCIIWLDTRSSAQAEKMNSHFGGAVADAGSYWAKLMWLRENRPDIAEQAVMILEVNSFLKWKATGETAVDISNCFTASFDEVQDRHYAALLAFAGYRRDQFPRLTRAEEHIGRLTESAAEAMGLQPGIPVFSGNNDIQACAVGSGCSSIGRTHVYFGTSGWIGTVFPHQPVLLGSAFDPERDIRMYGSKAMGLALNWVVDQYYAQEKAELGDGVFDIIARDVRQIPPGSDGVQAHPSIFRGMTADVRFCGVQAHHDRRYLARAVMESACCYIVCCYFAACREENRAKVVHAIGGGACSDEWMQILADLLQVPVRIPDAPRHAGAVGTAMSALIGLGYFKSFEDAEEQRHIVRTFVPIEENRLVYDEVRRRYGDLIDQTR